MVKYKKDLENNRISNRWRMTTYRQNITGFWVIKDNLNIKNIKSESNINREILKKLI
jgi:hypothetical protein